MPFKKGSPKPPGSGRKPGYAGIRKQAAEILERLKCNPIEGMAIIAADTHNSPELRGKMYAELAQYIWPKRRAVEHSGPDGGPVELNVSGTELLARRIASLAQRTGQSGGAERAN